MILLATFSSKLGLADGTLDPPHFYHTQADIDAALHAVGQEVPGHYNVFSDPLPPTASSASAVVVPASNVPIAMPLALVPIAPLVQMAETNEPTEVQGAHLLVAYSVLMLTMMVHLCCRASHSCHYDI